MSKFQRICPALQSRDVDGHNHPARPLDIDKAAVFLIKNFGDDSAVVAYSRACCCQCRGDENAAREWNAVMRRIVELLFSKREGPLH